MRNILLSLLVAFVGLTAYAQNDAPAAAMRFAYLSYDSVMYAMPEYGEMQKEMSALRAQYEAEQKRVEDDFNKKYEEFLDGQASFPKTILQKRQNELQEMLDKNIAFKRESQKLLAEAEAIMLNALKARIAIALEVIGQEKGYAFILNTDGDAAPWVNTALGDDITMQVKKLVK